ncbi:hypothetical protein, partial [Brachyspira catarrhinii]|uniref:hypothetical protein n=1 Tax=Brachyspira catarrhinii TaxID=2528966 RepID=UPI001F2F6BB8
NNLNFYISQFFKAFNFLSVRFRFAKNFVIPSICQNANESRLNKIRFYNLASLLLDCHDFLRSLAHAVRLTLCALATAMTCIFCHYEDEIRSNPKLNEFYTKWIATPSARNDNYFNTSLRGIGNAEAIKFTFDNLSRKIKNPCLVINILLIG